MELPQNLVALIGQELGASDWMTIDQERVDKFADATGDHQWIHIDPEKANAGPFGGTIAHGYLTLSLVVTLGSEVPLDVGTPKMAINYGLEKVRFPAPVPVGSSIRARVKLLDVSEASGGLQVNRLITIEIEGAEKPAMVAETVARYYY
jgi:acyl dehydratase